MTVTADDRLPLVNDLIIPENSKRLVRCKSLDYLTVRGNTRLLCCLKCFLRGKPHYMIQPAQISTIRTTASRVEVWLRYVWCFVISKSAWTTLYRFGASKLNVFTPRSPVDSSFSGNSVQVGRQTDCSRTLCHLFHLVCRLACGQSKSERPCTRRDRLEALASSFSGLESNRTCLPDSEGWKSFSIRAHQETLDDDLPEDERMGRVISQGCRLE